MRVATRYVGGWASIAIALAGVAHARASPPDIGATVREIEQERPLPSAPPIPALDIEQPSQTAPQSSSGPTFEVQRILVTGCTVYPASQLEALVAGFTRRESSLDGLRQAAATITRFYHVKGYPLARAYVPSQAVRDGVVEIAVLEGRYGKLEIHNEAGVSDRLLRTSLKSATADNVIRAAPLERDLLLLQELQGTNTSATLTPGEQVGTADLIVQLRSQDRFRGSLYTDNSGNRYTGQLRAGAGFSAANLAGRGDQLALRGEVTQRRGVIYGRGGYQIPIDGGLRIGASVTRTHYTLGRQFAALDANGNATISTLYALHPLIRSLVGGLDTQVAFNYQDLSDVVGATAISDRRWSRDVTVSLNGDIRDDVLGGGVTSGSIAYVNGYLQIRDPSASLIDQATAKTAGGFEKLSYTAVRLQECGRSAELYIALSGQLAGKNLDSSEKFVLGGPNAVRGYPQGEGVGDSGLLGTIELRRTTSGFGPFARPQLIAFFDGGRIHTNKNVFLPVENARSLYGAGVGLNLLTQGGFAIRGALAWKLGHEPALSDTDSASRLWIQIGKSF